MFRLSTKSSEASPTVGEASAPAPASASASAPRDRAPSAPLTNASARELIWPLAVAAFSRVLLAGALFCARYSFPLNPAYGWKTDAFGPGVVMDSLVRWDAWTYIKIAERGYLGDGHEAFFPLYPLLMKGLGALFGGPVVAGVLVSNVAFLADAVLLYALARQTLSIPTSRRAVALFVVHPSTVFFSSIYTESLFILLATASLLFARRGRFAPSAIFAMFATATRMPGVVLMPTLALYVLQRARWRVTSLRGADVRALAWVAIVPLGIALFAWHLKVRVGDPLAFVHAGALWGRKLSPPWMAFVNFFSYDGPIIGFNWSEAVIVVLALVGCVAAFRAIELPLAVFAAVSMLLPLSSGMISSMQRYTATAVPLYLVAALYTRRSFPRFALFATCGAACVYTTIAFALRYWAG